MQNKLIIGFIMLACIPLILSGIIYVKNSNRIVRDKISTYSLQLVKQINQNINVNIQKIENYSDDILISTDIYEWMCQYKNADDTDKAITRLNVLRAIQMKFLNARYVEDVMMVFMLDENAMTYDETNERKYLRWPREELDALIRYAPSGKYMLCLNTISGANDKCIIVKNKIENLSTSETVGYLLVALNQEYFRKLYRDINIGEGADVFIMDTDGVIISSMNQTMDMRQDQALLASIRKQNQTEDNTFTTHINGEMALVAYQPIEGTEWYIVSTIPYAYLNSENYQFTYRMALLTLIILSIAVVSAFVIARSISAPLKRLEKTMEEYGQSKAVDCTGEIDRKDEIGHLQKSFYRLISRIEEEHQLRRMSEVKVLEYQINPHFLYNTLDTINWMAQKAGHTDIGAMVTALARFFRLGLSNGREVYSVRDEMTHVQNYLTISKIRYRDLFDYRIHIDPSIFDYQIIKIILQPLVENAIKHGIQNQKNGMIDITGSKEGDKIVLTVSDNGKGMDEEKSQHINRYLCDSKDLSADEWGFGLINVQQRIRLYYGENYGLYIDSAAGRGTAVRVTLPARA